MKGQKVDRKTKSDSNCNTHHGIFTITSIVSYISVCGYVWVLKPLIQESVCVYDILDTYICLLINGRLAKPASLISLIHFIFQVRYGSRKATKHE